MLEEKENPGGTEPPDESVTDPDAGSPVPERDKDAEPTGPDADDTLPAPTPGM